MDSLVHVPNFARRGGSFLQVSWWFGSCVLRFEGKPDFSFLLLRCFFHLRRRAAFTQIGLLTGRRGDDFSKVWSKPCGYLESP